MHDAAADLKPPPAQRRGPMVDHTTNGTAYLPLTQQAAWGRGIALIARQLAR